MRLVSVGVIAALAAAAGAQPRMDSDARQILDGARRAMGLLDGEPVQLVAEATVYGPADTFVTVIHSSDDGRARMEQPASAFVAGVGSAGPWTIDPESGGVRESGDVLPFVRGHELHMMAMRPHARVTAASSLGPVPWQSRDALAVRMTLPGGERLTAYYSAADTLFLGLRVEWTEPEVVVSVSDWMWQDGVRTFRSAEFRQGDEVFRYEYTRVELGPLPDAAFEPPPSAGDAAAADSLAIVAASRAFSDAYVRNDTAALGRVYADSAVLLPPNRTVTGRAAIQRYFAWGPDYRQLAHAMRSERLTITGDVAVDVGTWTSTGQRGAAGPATSSERYLVVWAREADGQWRILYDMWHRPAR